MTPPDATHPTEPTNQAGAPPPPEPPIRHRPRRVLVTGGAGFIGKAYINNLLARDPTVAIVNVDHLGYAADREGLAEAEALGPARYRFLQADIADAEEMARLFAELDFDTVVNFAAESHVDRSIDGPKAFLRSNVEGVFVLLEAARAAWRERRDVRLHHVSTDEVYGSLGAEGCFTEASPYAPRSPYSATKAAADHLVRAWHATYGLPVTLSNCCNNHGPYQFPEKLVPLLCAKALAGEPLPIYGDGSHVRDWLYVGDHVSALDRVIRHGRPGRTYNIGGEATCDNLSLARLLCDLLQALRPRAGGYRELITFVPDRPGHDRRYAIDATRIRTELGWRPMETLETGLRRTVAWYVDHEGWLQRIRESRYDGHRLGGPRA